MRLRLGRAGFSRSDSPDLVAVTFHLPTISPRGPRFCSGLTASVGRGMLIFGEVAEDKKWSLAVVLVGRTLLPCHRLCHANEYCPGRRDTGMSHRIGPDLAGAPAPSVQRDAWPAARHPWLVAGRVVLAPTTSAVVPAVLMLALPAVWTRRRCTAGTTPEVVAMRPLEDRRSAWPLTLR